MGAECRGSWGRQGSGRHQAGGPRRTPNKHDGDFSRRLCSLSAAWYAGPICAFVVSPIPPPPPDPLVRPVCRCLVGVMRLCGDQGEGYRR